MNYKIVVGKLATRCSLVNTRYKNEQNNNLILKMYLFFNFKKINLASKKSFTILFLIKNLNLIPKHLCPIKIVS